MNKLHLANICIHIFDKIYARIVMQHHEYIRGSSNKEWDFFYGAVKLHPRLMKYHTYLVCPFGSSHATFLS